MEQVLDEFRQVARGLSYAPPTIPIVSTLTGRPATINQLCSVDYWVRHVREPVRFLSGMQCLMAEGVTACLELGPDAVLTTMAQSADEATEGDLSFVPLLRAGCPEVETCLRGVAELFVCGADVQWSALYAGSAAQRIALPTYPFQRQRYWLDAPGLRKALSTQLGDCRYRVVWKSTVSVAEAPLHGKWLVAIPESHREDPLVSGLLRGLELAGADVVPIELTAGEASRTVVSHRLGDALGDGAAGVLSLLALDEAPHPEHGVLPAGFALTVALLQALHDMDANLTVWCATRGAVSVGPGDPVRRPAQAMVWGMGRAYSLEQPERWGGLIDLPETFEGDVAGRLGAVLAGRTGEDHWALRHGDLWVRRLVRAERADDAPVAWRTEGTVVVTGGTGALGAACARWLARSGVKQLLLMSRRGREAPGADELQAELSRLGAEVTFVACDVADRGNLAGVMPERVTAVVHAAGVVGRTGPLVETSLENFADAMGGKVVAAACFDKLFEHTDLGAFVLFSSISGIWGANRGQPAYGAANAYLDALAEHRRGRDLAATSIAWGPWADGGMAADIDSDLRRIGLRPMAPSSAIGSLWQAVARGETGSVIVDVDWDQYLPPLTMTRATTLFDDLQGGRQRDASKPQAVEATGASDAEALLAQLEHLDTGERLERILLLVRTQAAAILGHASPEGVDPDGRFLDIGFDSLAAVQLGKRLDGATGLRSPAGMVLEHPTPYALARHLASRLSDTEARQRGGAGKSGGTAKDRPGWGLRDLFREACQRTLVKEGVDLLKAASKLRTFTECASDFGDLVPPMKLAAGPGNPALVCLPPFVAPSGPHNYAHLAGHFDNILDVYSMPNPGFGDGEPLPINRDLVVQRHCDTIRRYLGDRPFALAGYSSGGWITHCVASHLEQSGVFPKAIVLLDSLPLKEACWEDVLKPLRTLTIKEEAYGLTSDDQLTAMVAYFELFRDWKPTPVETPVLLCRADAPIPDWSGADEAVWRAPWGIPHQILEIAGDHFTLLKESAGNTAAGLNAWFESLEG